MSGTSVNVQRISEGDRALVLVQEIATGHGPAVLTYAQYKDLIEAMSQPWEPGCVRREIREAATLEGAVNSGALLAQDSPGGNWRTIPAVPATPPPSPLAPRMPSPGRIVHYVLSERDAAAISKRRADWDAWRQDPEYRDTGYQAHYGASVAAGDLFPAMVTCVHDAHSVNLRVLLDGTDDLWVTSARQETADDILGRWSWPPRM